jgi:hypothetical protein
MGPAFISDAAVVSLPLLREWANPVHIQPYCLIYPPVRCEIENFVQALNGFLLVNRCVLPRNFHGSTMPPKANCTHAGSRGVKWFRVACQSALGFLLLTLACQTATPGKAHFPGKSWEHRDPAPLGLNAALLDQLANELGGRGCVIKDGYVVKAWGDQSEVRDVLSSAKPVLSTLLFFAIEEGLVKSVDQPITDFGWDLKEKDRTMTFRQLGAMNSGYARPEAPGAAWAYNDYAIQLYQMTLFDRVFKQDAKTVAEDPKRLGALQFEDGLKFSDKRRISASVRDFARIAWFWANRGRWDGRQILPRHYFDDFLKPQALRNLPVSREAYTDDYLNLKSYGGGSEHFTRFGPGAYGFNWWFNRTGDRHRDNLTWPDAPVDTFMSIGAGGNNAAIIPSLGLVLVAAGANWNDLKAGDPTSKINQALKLAAASAGYRPESRALVSGEMKKWQPVTVSFLGPDLSETGTPNPFTDYRLEVTFHRGNRKVIVPGYFAADGNAAETGATAGRCWQAHFMPDEPGRWTYRAGFRKGTGIAISDQTNAGEPTAFDGMSGSFTVAPTEKTAPGFFTKGRLDYVGGRYLRFAETGEPWLKGGADSPENFLACADFDDTTPTLRFSAHTNDWRIGDPTWKDGKGKGIIGALNYLAAKRMNSVYMITMNVKGDGNDVRPWEKLWDHTAVALDFFHQNLPFTQMDSDDSLLTSTNGWCFMQPGEIYAVYLFGNSDARLKLPAGSFSVQWLNPWQGGDLIAGQTLTGPGPVSLGQPPANPEKDWVALVRRKK